MLATLIVIFLLLAAASLIWWGIGQLTLPQPVRVVVLVVFGLLCLGVIYNYVVGAHILAIR